MKSFNWTKAGILTLLAAGVVTVLIYLPGGRKDKAVTGYVNPAFAAYVSSYSSGILGSGSVVQVTFPREIADSATIGTDNRRLFSLSPSVKGTTVWTSPGSVEFRPEQRLKSGQVYHVDFDLAAVMEVPDEFRTFSFSFQVMRQNFEVAVNNILPYSNTDLKRQRIEGVIHTADYADDDAVEKMVKASQFGEGLTLSWTHGGEGRDHGFTIGGVSRNEEASTVDIVTDGDPIGVDRIDETNVDVPALGDFKLTKTKVVQHPGQVVILQFSDPLNADQSLKGLVHIPELADLDYEIRDNELWLYPPSRLSGAKTVYIEAGIRNILGYKLKDQITTEIVFEQLKPEVRFAGRGNILPGTEGLILPFEAVNLRKVDISVMKIFETNVLQFLQVNNLGGDYQLQRVGKRILRQTIPLESSGVTDLGKWNRYTLDLATMMNAEPGAIYQVRLSFKKAYSTFVCDEGQGASETPTFDDAMMEDADLYNDDEYDEYYYYEDYDWEQRDNPCHVSYYMSNRDVARNVLASDLGLLAKRGSDGNTTIVVTDLKTARPLAGVALEMYNYQQQLIGTATTPADGLVVIPSDETPFAVVARRDRQRGYLRLQDGESLSVSQFDVSGEVIRNGLKGFLYGERGVWRPGDTLHLTFVLEDRNGSLPANHPVIFEMQNPQGQVTDRQVRTIAQEGFYRFVTATSPDAPTGNWTGRVKVGGTNFNKTLRIETVKPNRLKIDLDFGTDRFESPEIQADLNVKWLHGAPARNLKAEFDVLLAKVNTTFSKFPDYVFEDPSREFHSESIELFRGFTDASGHANVNAKLDAVENAPGFLRAIFRGRVFEEGGNFSIDNFSLPYLPFPFYAGMRTPDGEAYSGILYTDTTHRVDLVTVDRDGKPAAGRQLAIRFYKLDQRWWWDYSQGSMANYINGNYARLVKEASVSTGSDGRGTWNFKVPTADWGRYFIQACDAASGHCTGKVVYLDEPGWYSRYQGTDARSGVTMLSVSSDKTVYNVGDEIHVTIPGSQQGRALVSIEDGTGVIQTHWVDTQAGDTPFSFVATAEMTPNVYVHVTLLQPHSQTVNDLPIRLYGVIPVSVEDPSTRLEPVIDMPDVLEPGTEVTIRVSEKSNRKMTYTLAVVDDGLLDLTRFKTPDLWNAFYAREALGVRTWDLFDQVMGAYGGKIERLLAIGGDGEIEVDDADVRANRFKPVVKFFGPFTIEGNAAKHSFVMPQYVGSVRTMVVAGNAGAYGKAEKTTPVRKPLMLLATLPRVLGPEEKAKLPVTLFASDPGIGQISVGIETTGPVRVSGPSRKTVRIEGQGEVTVDFDVAVGSREGISNIKISAVSGTFNARDEIGIEVRNPNTPVTEVKALALGPGESSEIQVEPFGIAGSNSAVLEVSSIPPLNLDSRLRYLMQYPYGCLEQVVSSVFPQLYLSRVKALNPQELSTVQRNVTEAISQLRSFIRSDGSFSYWPGMELVDGWATSYAGHFLTEAGRMGYYVPADIMRQWRQHQRRAAQQWQPATRQFNSDLVQAYRLYTLAVAGSSELGAMNRLRESGKLSVSAVWMLAGSYAKAGQPEAAKKIIENLPTHVDAYRESRMSYGSDFRDKAIILETLVLLNDKPRAFELLKELSARLGNSGYWLSTQEIAFALNAISSFLAVDKRGDLAFTHDIGGKRVSANSSQPVTQITIPFDQEQTVAITNDGTGTLFVRVIMRGTPARGRESDGASNLKLNVRYTDTNGNDIDPVRLEQGAGFIAEVTVSHPGTFSSYENLALTQVFPSGWEISNLRLEGASQFLSSDPYTYQDIRDDRVHTFFDLEKGASKTFRLMLTAAYAGEFYLPAVTCEAMYDNSRYARKKGAVVEVVKPATR